MDNIVKKSFLFPGQRHPKHKHFKKRETFHILSGISNYKSKQSHTHVGDKLDVSKDEWHSSTLNGAVFEEISRVH